MLTMLASFGAAFPLAGIVVTGWLSRAIWLGWIAFSLYAARGFYRLDHRAWLIYTVAMLALGLSSLVTFLRVDLLEYYRLAGLPQQQINQIAVSPLVRGHTIEWFSALGIILFGGYLVYVRRYFVAAPQAPTTTS